MRHMILVVCLWFSISSHAQLSSYNSSDRFLSSSPIRRGDGKIEAGPSSPFNNSSSFLTSVDTTRAKQQQLKLQTAHGGNPNDIRFTSLRVQGDLNAMQLSWTAAQQQFNAARFEIEESSDQGLHWTSIGEVPASQSRLGEVPYNFSYNKSLGDVRLRIVAINIAGDQVYSSILDAPSGTNILLLTPNPVHSTATVRIGSPAQANVRLLLVNGNGVVMQVREAGLSQGTNPVTVDMSNVPPGYYTLSIVWPGGKQDAIQLMKQ